MAMFDSVWHLKEPSHELEIYSHTEGGLVFVASSVVAIAIDASAGDTRPARRLEPRECDHRQREPSSSCRCMSSLSRLEYFSYTHRRKCWMAPYRLGAFPDSLFNVPNLCAFKFLLLVVD
jgi:hypothetical protein